MQTKTLNTKKVNFRNVKPHEYDRICEFDENTFYRPLTDKEFKASFTTRKTKIKVFTYDKEETIGYMIIQLMKDKFFILRMVVDIGLRRNGVGTRILELLKKKLTKDFRHTIDVLVDERNLDAQLFLKANGFKWTQTIPQQNSDYDLYCLSYSI